MSRRPARSAGICSPPRMACRKDRTRRPPAHDLHSASDGFTRSRVAAGVRFRDLRARGSSTTSPREATVPWLGRLEWPASRDKAVNPRIGDASPLQRFIFLGPFLMLPSPMMAVRGDEAIALFSAKIVLSARDSGCFGLATRTSGWSAKSRIREDWSGHEWKDSLGRTGKLRTRR